MLNALHLPQLDFPKDFLWGSATAAHQIEGGDDHSANLYRETTENYAEKSGLACDHWHRWKEDFQLLKELGHNAYRLSLAWSRLEPEEGVHDPAALAQYLQMLEFLKTIGVKTFVTISHGSKPQWFSKAGDFRVRDNIKFFLRHLQWLIPKIKDYADFFLILNEFNIGGGPSLEETCAFRANSLIAHAKGYRIIKSLCDTPISSAHALRACAPENPFEWFDRQFAALDDWLSNEFFFHGVRTGEIVLPYRDVEFVPELKDALDFYAINYYCRRVVSARSGRIDGQWPTATHLRLIDKDFYLEDFYPEGLTHGLLRCKDRPVYITENGVACEDDRWRILKMALDLAAAHDAIRGGVDLRGYLHWSLLDNYEWSSFVPRFGLVHVNFATQKRTPKPSAFFLREIAQCNSFSGKTVQKYLPEMPILQFYPKQDTREK
ncbi:MAG: family 1 glycosylhydrolase [Victivallaceae bacterium]|nr:family 1 glycosylhydrolase [Victivallaceae bacterium]